MDNICVVAYPQCSRDSHVMNSILSQSQPSGLNLQHVLLMWMGRLSKLRFGIQVSSDLYIRMIIWGLGYCMHSIWTLGHLRGRDLLHLCLDCLSICRLSYSIILQLAKNVTVQSHLRTSYP